MNRILIAMRRPHPGYTNLNVYFTISIAIAAGVFLVLSLMQPFNLNSEKILWGNPYLTALTYAVGSYFTMLINGCWLVLFPRIFSDERWTLGKEILMCIYQMISIATTIWLINCVWGGFPPSLNGYLKMLWMVVRVGFFPCLTLLLIRHIFLMRMRLRKATTINIRLMLNDKKTPDMDNPQYINLQRIIKPIDINAFISAESKEDSLVVNIAHNSNVERLVVNSTLEEFESENIHFDQLFRCHDKFIINREKITWVEGNAAGYKFILHPKLPPVFVSRKKAAEFKKRMDAGKFA